MKYNIYAGLGGGFGGPTYQGTGEFDNEDSAIHCAYELAVEEYQSYEGYHGILDWSDVAEQEELDPETESDSIDQAYIDEIESWIEYYAVLMEEDEEFDPEEYYEV